MIHMERVDARPRLLAAILAIGLIVRLAWGLSRPVDAAAIDLLPDQRGYLEIAQNLLSGAGLHYVDVRFEQTVYAARTPGYPAFVAVCGASVRAVRVVQALIDTSTALAVYLLARQFISDVRGPLFAAALVAFNPFLVYFSALLLTETLYTSMLAWGMVLLVTPRSWWWVFGTTLLALAILVRPPGIGLPVLLTTLAMFNRRRAVGAAAAAVLITVIVLGPWALRNHGVLNRWLWSTTNDGISLYDGFHPAATGASEQAFVEQMPQVKSMGEVERSEYFKAEALRFIRENPGRVVTLTLAKFARTWSPIPLSTEFGRPLYRVVAGLFAVPFYVLVIVGVVRGGLKRSTVWFLLAPALYFTVIHAMSVGSLRYRIPVEPVLAVLAGAGLASVLWRKPNEERAAPS